MILALILFNICHFLGDYTHLSMPYMLKAKATGSPWLPIFHHSWIHAVLMCGATCIITPDKNMWCFVTGIQLLSHFIIDTLKGKCNVWFPHLKDISKYPHWYVFGLDQFAHQLVIITLAYMVSK